MPSTPNATLNQHCDQPQQRPMLGISGPSAQEGADVDMRGLASGWAIWLMTDEDLSVIGVARKKPSVTVGAGVEFSDLDWHPSLLSQHGLADVSGLALDQRIRSPATASAQR